MIEQKTIAGKVLKPPVDKMLTIKEKQTRLAECYIKFGYGETETIYAVQGWRQDAWKVAQLKKDMTVQVTGIVREKEFNGERRLSISADFVSIEPPEHKTGIPEGATEVDDDDMPI